MVRFFYRLLKLVLFPAFSSHLRKCYLAWAHLILYGEEATKKAQREGEEAVAVYQQQQIDGNVIDRPKIDDKRTQKGARSQKKNFAINDGIVASYTNDMAQVNLQKVTKL